MSRRVPIDEVRAAVAQQAEPPPAHSQHDDEAVRLEAEGEAYEQQASAASAGGEDHATSPTCDEDDEGTPKKAKRKPGKQHVRLVREGEDAWRNNLITSLDRQTGAEKPHRIAANVVVILRHHPVWKGVVAWDAFADCVVTLKKPQWHFADLQSVVTAGTWTDGDTHRLVNWLARAEQLHVSPQVVESALTVVAETNVVHPVKDYLDSLKWDGVDRLSTVLPKYFATTDSPYTRGVGQRWMISAVARIFAPGCQADCTLILESGQGSRKNSAFRSLVPVPGWYQDTGIDPRNKDSFEALRSVWIYGLDELDSLNKAAVTTWKSFLTSVRDHYRPPYAHRTKDFPRQCVFCGNTNGSEYLVDRTGNRRFWPVAVIGEIDTSRIERDRDQLWAETAHRYRAGEKWHVDTVEFRTLCEKEQQKRVKPDDWLPTIANWLATPEALEFTSAGVLTLDVIRRAIGKDIANITTADSMRAAECLRELGYEVGPQHRENGARVRRYVKKGSDET